MKPPMHDDVILLKPDGTKDDQGFPNTIEIPVIGRVTQESQMITSDRDDNIQSSHTVILPNTVTPSIGDQIKIGPETVKVLKVYARKSYSGKKIFYWVTNCGE
jgi:hypothetical protein